MSEQGNATTRTGDDSGFDTDVVVIGYGPSGVSAALNLGADGISCIALERDRDLYQRARAVTVNDWTMRCFQSVGADRAVFDDLDETQGLQWLLYDGTQIARVDFPPMPFGYASGYAIYQPYLEAQLRQVASEMDSVDVRFGMEVVDIAQDDDGVTVTYREVPEEGVIGDGATTTIRAKYALACDGGSSFTRTHLGIEMEGDTNAVRWVVIDAKVKRWWPNRHLLTFWSDKDRPVVDIALARDNHRWEIPLREGERDEDFATAEQVWPLLEALGVTHDMVEIHQHAFYNHHIRSAERWRDGRVFLLGDAGHLMPPWAGAGMQSGIRDAFNVTWKLRDVLAGRADDALLDSYESERRPNVAFYTNVAIQLGRIIKQELTPEEQEALAPKPDQEPELPPLLWPPAYADGWFRGSLAQDSIVGKMVIQPRIGNSQGLLLRLDEHLGRGVTLLGDGVDPASVLSAEEKAGWDRLGARYRAVRSPDQGTEGPDELVDLKGELLAWMRRFGARVIAVRPDRFVAASDREGLAVPEPGSAQPAPAPFPS